MLSLSNPQNVYLNQLNTKYRGYIGGFGCVSPDTKIWTENGLIRISDIDRPMRVLSLDESTGQCQLSLSGGAYPKGKANLYRVVTQQGEFVASEHHHSLCADGSYRRVDSLCVGDELSSFDSTLLSSISEHDLLSLPSNAQHYSKTTEGLMGHYANEARQYGQQLLDQSKDDLISFPSLDDVQRRDLLSSSNNHLEQELSRNHLSQSSALVSTIHFQRPFDRLGISSVGHTLTLCAEHISRSLLECWKSLLMTSLHHKDELYSSACHSSNLCSLVKTTSTILTIEQLDYQEEFWDMQVLDTNNYVTEDGVIHHNSGKTFVGCLDLCIFAAKHPKTVQGYFGPTYPAIRDIFYPTFEEAANLMGFTCDIKESNKEVHLYRGRVYYGTVICRSMDNPNSIVGFKIARALVDEIDVLEARKAENAWNKIIARMRLVIDGVQNSIGVTTTPEGFKFVYEKFANNPTESYSMVQASTYENAEFLPPDYIDTLIETYPKELIKAYLQGQFVNLTSGTIYSSYDRIKHRSKEIVKENEPVFIGMDFNISKMAATIYVMRDKAFHAVDEIVDGYNTPSVAEIIKERYKDNGNKVIIYPDSSGKNRTRMGGASESDIAILQNDYGFECRYKSTNPAIKDRINATNAAFDHGNLFVNDEACPQVAACYEQQSYDANGEPDKKGGKDHQNDASTYPIAYEMPIIKPVTNVSFSF